MKKNLTIHKYSDDYFTNEDYEDLQGANANHYPLSSNFIRFIADKGWEIMEKIGEGAVSTVFSCRKEGKEGALILLTNLDCRDRVSLRKLTGIFPKIEIAKTLPQIFPVIYDVYQTDIPYSDDAEYMEHSCSFVDRPIQIMERMDMTIDVYIRTLSPEESANFITGLEGKILNMLLILNDHGANHSDISPTNIGVKMIGGTPVLRLLDIESMSIGTSCPPFFAKYNAASISRYLIDVYRSTKITK